MTMTRRMTFRGAYGDTLVGRLHQPDESPVAVALFAHCFTCSKDLHAAVRISSALADRGVAVFRFDFTGLGESEGDFADTNFSSNIDDLVAAADHLREHLQAPQLLVGHSLGGAAVIAAAHRIPESKAVTTIGAPCDPAHVRHLIDASAPDLSVRGEATVQLGGRSFQVKKQLLEDLSEQAQTDRLAKLGRALLVFHSPLDEIVGIDNATRIFTAAKHPKSFVSLDRADHLLTRARDAEFVASVAAAWSARYVPQPQQRNERDLSDEHGTVVAELDRSRFKTRITAGHHHLLADEPESVGGTDTGPGPYELLLSALGACTAMTLRLYADRKEWPLEAVRVSLTHQKVSADECPDCRHTGRQVDKIEKVLELEGELDEAQRARLAEIAERCPVNRTLKSDIVIRSQLKD